MSLGVRENKFYILTKKEGQNREIKLYVDMETPVKDIKEYLKSGVETENLELVTVEMKEEKYQISSIPWSVIASKLVKES